MKSPTPKPPISVTPQPRSAKKCTYVASRSNQQPADQQVDEKKKGTVDKEVPADLNNPNKKIWISTNLDAK
jgi:hypothetical protein